MTGILSFALDCVRMLVVAALALIPGTLFWLLIVGVAIALDRVSQTALYRSIRLKVQAILMRLVPNRAATTIR